MHSKELKKPIIILFVILLAGLFIAGYLMETYTDKNVIKFLHLGEVAGEYILTALELAAIIYGLFNINAIRIWLAKHIYAQVKFEKTGEPFKNKVEGVIIPISNRKVPEWIIKQLRPKFVCLLYTDWSRNTALQLVTELKGSCKFIPNEEEIRNSENVIKPEEPAAAKEGIWGAVER